MVQPQRSSASRTQKLILAAGMLFCAGVFLLPLLLWLPLGSRKPFQRLAYDKAVQDILSGSLKPDARGIVLLPTGEADLSVTRRAYVFRGDTGKPLIFFPTWLGREQLYEDDYWASGYLYDAGSSVVTEPGEANGWNELPFPEYTAPWNAAWDDGMESHSGPILTTHRYSRNWFEIEDLPS